VPRVSFPMANTVPSVAEEHLRRVQAVTDAALAHLTVDTLLDELLSRVRELLRADTAAVLLIDEQAGELVATAAKGIEEEVEQGVRLPVGGGFAGRIAASGIPVVLDEVDHGKVLNPLLLKRGIRSMLGVPLIVGGRIIGVLHVGTLHRRRFTQNDIDLLQLVADRAALAVQARRQHQHRVMAEAVQKSFLPERFPHVKGVQIAGHYSPAEGGMVGGDWYDVFLLKSGELCVVVGDIAGRGVQAAIAMARVRDAVRAIAFLEESPATVVSRVNDFVLHFDPGVMATMFIGIIEGDGLMRYSNAGHLPPLFVDRHGRAQIIEESAEPPLGSVDFWTYRDRQLDLRPPSTLILYTDGLVERRGHRIDDGLEALKHAAEAPWTNLDTLCSRIFGGDLSDSGRSDDVAVLALHFGADRVAEEIHTRIDADPRGLAPLRRALRSWLAVHGADEQQTQDILIAVGEAAANSIEHAHAPGRGSVEIDGVEKDGVFEITVRDQGVWREPRGTNRGLGRSLMKAMMDEVIFHTDKSGTTVTLRKRVR